MTVEGKITRISGPIVFAEGLDECGLYDVVDVGEKKLIGEIIRQNKGKATVQVYEYDTGMHVGEKIVSYGRPLSLRLGPGLVGTIYDGIQRPLESMYEDGTAFLLPGQRTEPLDTKKTWHFDAGKTSDGKTIGEGSPIAPGSALGTVRETPSVLHTIMVPPYIRGRVLKTFKGSCDCTVDDVIATTELDEEIKLSQYWPVRTPRPYTDKLTVSQPLVTGLRVIDVFFPLSKGGTAAIPGGFGTGKTMTQHAIAKWCDADLIVYIGCGERGNEMTDVLTEFPEIVDPRTGRSIMERTILIANTSNMPVAAREVSLYSGITLAEYYRDMGMAVAIMADSTSRWAHKAIYPLLLGARPGFGKRAPLSGYRLDRFVFRIRRRSEGLVGTPQSRVVVGAHRCARSFKAGTAPAANRAPHRSRRASRRRPPRAFGCGND